MAYRTDMSEGRSCAGKHRYETRKYAKGRLRVLRAKRRDEGDHGWMLLSVYRCQHCDGFHIGHASRKAETRTTVAIRPAT